MKYYILPLILILGFLFSCSHEEATELERTNASLIDELEGEISPEQMWTTTVAIKVNVITDTPVKLWLLSSKEKATFYEYVEMKRNGTIVMTAPQGQEDIVYLTYICNNKVASVEIALTGKAEETVTINTNEKNDASRSLRALAPSLVGNSIIGRTDSRLRAQYYEFEMGQLYDFFTMMNLSRNNTDAKELGLNVNYELISNGPFTITWVNGYEADQDSRILGYYYHSPGTYDDIKYVDLSETHKWDYIDGLAKVQYKLDRDVVVDGHTFLANTWYDANYDYNDSYGSTFSRNMDRIGDNAYNMQAVFNRYPDDISSLRGISFDVDVPIGMHIGFYLRSDERPFPDQWRQLQQMGVKPYTNFAYNFMGTCYSAEALNIDGLHRSFVMDQGEVIWMGMEDIVEGGDYDCNDVIFGVVTKVDINYLPDITVPNFFSSSLYDPFPWTLAFEDVYRDADFDFNDAVIKLQPDYENELCCVTVMAAGSTSRMYLHYDGPDGDQNLGEIHELLGQKDKLGLINTTSSMTSTPFVRVDCVPWPKGYTMNNDAKRFYIEVQRGTCTDCTNTISLPNDPGLMPEAILVAGEWKWPQEDTHILTTYPDFSKWAKDVTRTRFWEWYKSPTADTYVSY